MSLIPVLTPAGLQLIAGLVLLRARHHPPGGARTRDRPEPSSLPQAAGNEQPREPHLPLSAIVTDIDIHAWGRMDQSHG
jgi:hypothetical protein